MREEKRRCLLQGKRLTGLSTYQVLPEGTWYVDIRGRHQKKTKKRRKKIV